MFKKITALFSKKDPAVDKVDNEYYQIVLDLVSEIKSISTSRQFVIYDVKFSELIVYQKLKKQPLFFRKEFTSWLVKDIVRICSLNKKMAYENRKELEVFRVQEMLLPLMFRSNLGLSDTEVMYYLDFFRNKRFNDHANMNQWPVGFLVQQLERKVKKNGLSDFLSNALKEMLTWSDFESDHHHYYGADMARVKKKIEDLIFNNGDSASERQTFRFNDKKDPFGEFSNTVIEKTDDKLLDVIFPILHLCVKVSGAKPSKKFLNETSTLVNGIDFVKYKQFVYQLLEKVVELKPREEEYHTVYDNRTHSYSVYEFIEKENVNTLKGLVWTLTKFHDVTTLTLISKLAERSFKKIPGVGPTAMALGNACIYVLANTKGMHGVSQLSVLKQRIKQTSTKKLIEKYLKEASEKLGVSESDIEESIVPEFGLKLGEKEITFEDYIFKIQVEGIGKVKTLWVKPDGKIQKTIPTFVKNSKSLSEKIKKVKLEIKEIQRYLTTQRDRFDGLFIEEKKINHENFKKYYFNHGLVSFLTRKLIWIVTKGDEKSVIFYLDNQWIDARKNKITWVDESCSFQLWHPIYDKADEVLKWRQFILEMKIVQPLKQAFREVYMLTPAEVNTKNYSNRMASHIIKQHQFSLLAKIREWEYQLIGAWDHGSDCIARKTLKKTGITAEYFTNEIYDEHQINDVGILLYMSTDQVRFVKNNESLDLVDVPLIIFSEIMRDVDLFVGVCSVGNDPEWSDNGGMPQYRDYWHSYSFGDLTEVAKTRKSILENLLPRLSIKDCAKIEGKFLVVKGKLTTYKIHIGSTNILMEPNDMYLCIVPSGKKDMASNVYLPFEGDRGLSVVLSKAFMLANDDKITDTTITRQIKK